MNVRQSLARSTGFTLIEVMLVIVLIGIFVSTIQFNFYSNKPEKTLEQQAQKFYGLFTLAAEYSLLNNVELGIVFTKTSYRFVGYDGNEWVQLPEQEQLPYVEMPEGIDLKIELDDLPIDDPVLFDPQAFVPEDDDFSTEEEKRITPQVFILSGGDISPFQLTFAYDPRADFDVDVYFQVLGSFTLPLELKGPLSDEG